MTGLVLGRLPGEAIRIGEDIWVEVDSVVGTKVRLRIIAPLDTTVWREELLAEEERER